MRLENRMSRWPRIAGDFVDNLRSGAIGPTGIRVSTKRQVLNRFHEFFEIEI